MVAEDPNYLYYFYHTMHHVPIKYRSSIFDRVIYVYFANARHYYLTNRTNYPLRSTVEFYCCNTLHCLPQTASPVVVNMQRNDSVSGLRGEMKYDQAKLSMNHGLPFMYPHYPSVYTNPGGRETRLFSSVATQTNRAKKTEASKLAEENTALVNAPRTRNSETQTAVARRRDKETQWVNLCEAPTTFSTQTEIISKNISQQMPSASDTCLVHLHKSNDDELEPSYESFVRADSIRSVFGRNRTHVVIYRPELVGEDNDTVKLTAMDVFLPGAVTYDRYYAELTSDGTASPNNDTRTPRENGQLTESVTPLIEVTAIGDQSEEGDGKKKKSKKWFCHKH